MNGMVKRGWPLWAALALLSALLLAACGSIVDMGQTRTVNSRRAFANDAAENDSLENAIVREAVQLWLQPGKAYQLRMKTDPGDSLVFFSRTAAGDFARTATLGSGPLANGFRAFALTGTKTTPDQYLVVLRDAAGSPAARPDSVRLATVDTVGGNTIAVRLLMVRSLRGLETDDLKAAFAREFHQALIEVYQGLHGITVDTSTLIVEGAGEPITVDFDGAITTLPGIRRPNAINLYLVDSIHTSEEGTILGFAPREAFDLSSHVESRVLLNARAGSASSLAVTAAHEMGHFLGLRHTNATDRDLDYDDDLSNADDGFASTPPCDAMSKPGILAKSAARTIMARGPRGRPYCLRVAGVTATCACPDRGNLMYPYACTVVGGQKALGADQRDVLRRNLKMLQPN